MNQEFSSVCVCAHVYAHMYICVCVYIYACVYVCTYKYKNVLFFIFVILRHCSIVGKIWDFVIIHSPSATLSSATLGELFNLYEVQHPQNNTVLHTS